jgi:hypothetical protein
LSYSRIKPAEEGESVTERRWPTLQEVEDKTKKHILDDRMAAVPTYELEDWEILGEPAPDEAAAGPADRATVSKRSRRRRE